ncbi:MAG: hypothetical protein RKE49_10880 [Oceanicaulis sp.]
MSDAKTPQARFSTSAALGYAWVIFRARPGSFIRLTVLQSVIFSVTGFASIWLMGRAGLNADAPTAEQFAILMRTSALTSGLSLIVIPLWVWIEAMWLDVFFNRSPRLWPGWGDYGRLLLTFVIALGIFFVGYMALLFAGVILISAAAFGGAGPAILAGLAVFGAVIAFLLLVQMRLTALPALAFARGGVPFGKAWRLVSGRFGALTLAWIAYGLLYLLALIATLAVMALTPVDFLAGIQAAIAQPENPLAQYAVYSPLVTDAGAAAATFIAFVVLNLLFTPIMTVARGVGVRLALEAEGV